MKVTVKNLGVIKEGSIDLDKNLIIFCGKNNTGKTVLSYFLYALSKTTTNLKLNDSHFTTLIEDKGLTLTYDLVSCFEYLKKYVGQSIHDSFTKSIGEGYFNHPSFNDKLSFDIDFNFQKLNPNKIIEDLEISFDTTLRIKTGKLKTTALKEISQNSISYFLTKEDNTFVDEREVNKDIFTNHVINVLINNIYKRHLPINSKFFSAERIAINIFAKAVSIQGLEGNPLGENFETESQQRYNFVLREAIIDAVDLDNLSFETSEFSYLADAIQEMLQGRIQLSQYGLMQYVPDQDSSKLLDMQSSSSSVKSLADIIFYFKHIAKKGTILFIDEPELNLHPDLQRKFARVLVQAANAGIKVIMSTHSDHIIREINNMIMLSDNSEASIALRNKYGYSFGQIIKPDLVDCYIFKDQTIVKEVIAEFGIEIQSIDEEIHNLNVSSSEIYSTLYDN